jgi:uncharacterized integral membrane protein
MKSLANLSAIILVACWMLAIAFISVQNAQPTSITFFGQQSVAMPFGLMLTFTAVLGMVGMSLLQPLLFPTRRDRSAQEDDYS